MPFCVCASRARKPDKREEGFKKNVLNFLKKNKKQEAAASVSGKCIRLDMVNDPVFSSKAMGDGVAIVPEDGTVCAPCDGKLTLVANTGHAFGLTTDNGTEFLVHIGIDTVELNGEGFEVLAKAGSNVKKGQPIIRFDMDFMKKKNMDMTTMVLLLNSDNYKIDHLETEKRVRCGADPVIVFSK